MTFKCFISDDAKEEEADKILGVPSFTGTHSP